MRFFLPFTSERADMDYDWVHEVHSGESSVSLDYSYAHEVLGDDIYDGILFSRFYFSKTIAKQADALGGMRKFLRLKKCHTLIGDCGAFTYITEPRPTVTTDEVIEYYDRFKFDLGVSVDHILDQSFDEAVNTYRYELTMKNAEEFIRKYRQGRYHFEPLASIQGWDVSSYVEAAQAAVQMGYDYLALGGIVKAGWRETLQMVEAVRENIPSETNLHVFGNARKDAIPVYLRLNVTSFDNSGTMMGARHGNYAVDEGRPYRTLWVPLREKTGRVGRGGYGRLVGTEDDADFAERRCMVKIRSYDRGEVPAEDAWRAFVAFNKTYLYKADLKDARLQRAIKKGNLEKVHALMKKNRKKAWIDVLRTLRDKPWDKCECAVCERLGVEVMILRGKIRVICTGFHNLHVFRKFLSRARREFNSVQTK